mmetsp:Transcript_11117/g.41520  ORF Transcript_11117/g.41520 Transcript_11117/m.41520 type:complete len:210 (-) Transcript_11117:528-1157(-)
MNQRSIMTTIPTRLMKICSSKLLRANLQGRGMMTRQNAPLRASLKTVRKTPTQVALQNHNAPLHRGFSHVAVCLNQCETQGVQVRAIVMALLTNHFRRSLDELFPKCTLRRRHPLYDVHPLCQKLKEHLYCHQTPPVSDQKYHAQPFNPRDYNKTASFSCPLLPRRPPKMRHLCHTLPSPKLLSFDTSHPKRVVRTTPTECIGAIQQSS